MFVVTIATLASGVQALPDSRIAFPPPNELPNQQGDLPVPGVRSMAQAYRSTAAGTTIGGFTPKEIQPLFVATNTNVADELPSLRYPVVLQAPAPAVGTVMTASESAPILGRVIRIVAQRNGFVLAQLEVVELATAFDSFTVKTDVDSLLTRGFVRPEQLIEKRASGERATGDERGALIGPPSPQSGVGTNAFFGKCKTEGTIAPIEFKPATLLLNPKLDIDFQIAKDRRTGEKYLAMAKFVVQLNATLKAGGNVSIQPGVVGSHECELGDELKISPPNLGAAAILNLVLGPSLAIVPKFGVKLKIQGGPRLSGNLGFKLDLVAKAGFIRSNPNNTGAQWEFPRELDFTPKPDLYIDGIDGFDEMLNGRAELKIGLYETGQGRFTIGGGIFDKLDVFSNNTLWEFEFFRDLEQALTFDFLKTKVGPELKIEWATPGQVITTRMNGASAGLNIIAEGELKSEAIQNALKKVKLEKIIIPEIKLFTFSRSLFAAYRPLKPVKVGLEEGDIVKDGRPAKLQIEAEGSGLYAADLYVEDVAGTLKVGSFTTDPRPNYGSIRKEWMVPKLVCDRAKEADDGYVEIMVIGYNRMFNMPLFGSAPEFLPTANWLGTFKVSCADVKIDQKYTVDGTSMTKLPYEGFTRCATDRTGAPTGVHVKSSAIARTTGFGFTKLSMETISLYPDKEIVVPGDGLQSKIEGALDFVVTPPRKQVFLHIEAESKTSTSIPRKTGGGGIIRITWYDCAYVTEYNNRWEVVDSCYSVPMRSYRDIITKRDPLTNQVVEVEKTPWSEWRQNGDMVQTGECRGRTVRTRGDPHIVTPDGHEFDSFALGEFVYLEPRPGNNGITVQVRQERIQNSEVGGSPLFMPWTSYNTAMAFQADNQTFEFRQGQLHKPLVNGTAQTLTPGLYTFGAVDLKVNSARQVELSWNGYTFVVDQVWTFIELRAQVPRNNTHYGLLGTPNGRESDDMQLRDGTPVSNPFDLANGWRVTSRDRSLFTYATGTGPETYNLPQINEPPSREELAPYIEQARRLLLNTCKSDTLSDVALNNTALELYTGRTAAELASTGLCWYTVRGIVSNQFVPELPVPGATVTVVSGDHVVCETYTDRSGFYSCQVPAQGNLPTVTVRVSGRGSAEARVAMTELPPMDGTIDVRTDLRANPTTVEITGLVKDSLDRPLYNAEVQVQGPANAGSSRAFAVAQGDGSFKTYIMVNDGVLAGNATYRVSYNPSWNREPTAPAVVYTFTRALPALRANALTPATVAMELTGSVVRFSGKVAFENDDSMTVPGVRVSVKPTEPIAGWNGCDVYTLVKVDQVRNPRLETTDPALAGTYICDVPLTRTAPFSATVQVVGQPVKQVVTAEPAGRGVGDVVPVVADLLLPSGMLRIEGLVREPNGTPVAGANVHLQSPDALQQVDVRTDPTGRYTTTLALRSTARTARADFRVTYGSVSRSQSFTYGNIFADQINVRTQNWTLSGRLLTFRGRLVNTMAPTALLSGTLVISTTNGTLCNARINDGSYECTVAVDTNQNRTLAVRYEATGAWGARGYWVQLTDLPGLGGERTFIRDIPVSATTLRLRGIVRSTTNAPIPGASVRVAFPGGQWLAEGKTDPNGRYELFLTLAQHVTVQRVEYTVGYRNVIQTGTADVVVQPGQATTFNRDWVYGYRTMTFNGTVSNPYNAVMPASEVRIAAPGLVAPCVTQTAADGSYLCAVQTTATAPLVATFTAKGIWGTQTFTQTVNLRAQDDRTTHVADLVVSPTVARIQGMVTAPNGTPLGGVVVGASGSAAYRPVSTTSTASGRYDLLVVLATPAEALSGTGIFTRSLQLQAGYGTAVASRTVEVVGRANALVDLDADWMLDARTLQFRGSVTNGLLGGNAALLRGTRVVVSSPALGVLCEWSSAQRFNLSTYACDAQVFIDTPFDVRYSLSGAWGTAVVTSTSGKLPSPGGSRQIDRSLVVRPATVQLTGRVVDRNGLAVANARVTVRSAQFLETAMVATGTDGSYKLNAVVRAGIVAPTVDYTVAVNGEPPAERQVSFDVVASAITKHQEHFTFDVARRVDLSGKLINTTAATLPLGGRLLIVSPTTNQELCTAQITNGTYSCTVLVRTSQAFTLNYRVDAPWGSLTVLNETVPANAKVFAKDLQAAPRVVRVAGSVRNAAGDPLSNASMTIASASFAGPQLQGVTASDGSYTGLVVVRDGVSNGALDYTVSANGNRVDARGTFAFAGTDRLTTATQNLTVRTRTITFTGTLRNTLVANAQNLPQTQVVVRSPQLGRLCATYATPTYSCAVTLDTAAAFDVVYDLSGVWGSATLTDRVASLPAAGTAANVVFDLSFTPTMLRLTGRAVDARNMPVADVTVSSSSPRIVRTERIGLTDADGRYELLVVLAQVTGTESGTLPLVANFRNTAVTMEVPFTATAGRINQVDVNTAAQPFEFERRVIVLKGALVNTLAPTILAARPSGRITMQTPTGGNWCAPTHGSSYDCTIEVYDDVPIDVTITAVGEWGTASRGVHIATIPAADQHSDVTADLEVVGTALHVSGRVVLPNGTGLVGASMRVALLVENVEVEAITMLTKANGVYDQYLLPPSVARIGKLRYTIVYEGITSVFETSGLTVKPGQIDTINEIFTWEQRRVRFSGRLTSSVRAGLPLLGRVSITSRDFYTARFCDAVIATDGRWTCDAFVRSSDPFTVTYRFSGVWGSKDVQGEVAEVPAAGGTTAIVQDATALSTIVRLQGAVADRSGEALAGAQVTVNGTSVMAPATVTTGPQGRYSIDVVVGANVTAGSFQYGITYHKTMLNETHTFQGLNANAVNIVQRDFELRSRELTFNGQVLHEQVSDYPLTGKVRISTPTGLLCEATTDANGGYVCRVAAVTTEAFSATYTVSSDWGSQQHVLGVDAGDAGTTATITRDVRVSPTTLRLQGVVRSPSNQPVAGVEIKVGSANLSSATRTLKVVSDQNGAYDLTIVLRDGKLADTLAYQLRLGATRGSVGVLYTAVANAVTPLAKTISFTSRRIEFKGTIRNAYAPGVTLAGTRVEVYSPDLGDLCAATSDDQGSYACVVDVLNTESFRVEYNAISSWGRTVYGGMVEAAAAGSSSVVNKSLLITPSTLHLAGVVTDADGEPLAGATVRVDGTNVIGTPHMTTGADGGYSLYVMAPAGVSLATLRYVIEYDEETLRYTYPARFERAVMSEVPRNFTFAVRTFMLSGTLRNAHSPQTQLRATNLTISSPTHGALCTTITTNGNAYECRVQVSTTTPFDLEYRVSGDWGTATITGTSGTTLPPVGEQGSIVRNLDIAPATVVVTGFVRDGNDAPLRNAIVTVISNTAVSGLNLFLQAQTTATGAYTLPLVLRSGVASGSFDQRVSLGGVELRGTTTFAVPSSGVVTVQKNWTIASRRVTFAGSLVNSRVANLRVPAEKVTVSSPTLGTICTWTSAAPGSSSYLCEKEVSTNEAFDVTYTVTGDWGTATQTGRVAAGPWGAPTVVNQNLAVAPTVLRLHGTVKGTGDVALKNAQVTVSSAAFSVLNSADQLKTVSRDNGLYELYVVVRKDVANASIRYTVTSEGSATVTHTATFVAGEVTSVVQTLQIEERTIAFGGNVQTVLTTPPMPLSASSVQVSSSAHGALCSWNNAGTAPTVFRCQSVVSGTDAFSVTYTVRGDWGTATFPGTVPAGVGGTQTSVNTLLDVRPTMLHLSGKVTDPDQQPLAGTRVTVEGAAVSPSLHAKQGSDSTDANGDYDFYVVLTKDVTAGTLDVVMSRNGATVTSTVPFTATNNALTALAANLEFRARGASFSGNVRHKTLPWMLVPRQSVAIAAPGLTMKPCPPDTSASAYRCDGQLNTTDVVTATYTVTGMWGMETITGSIASNDWGSSTDVTRDLFVSPTTLRISGTVRNSANQNLDGALVVVTGNNVLARQQTTSVGGEYEMFVLLKGGADSTTLNLTVSYQSASQTSTRVVNAAAHAVTNVEQPFTFRSRRIDFGGDVVHAVRTDVAIPGRIHISSPALATDCFDPAPNASGYRTAYACTADVLTTDSFPVTYTVSADWGTTVITGTVAAGAEGSRTTVNQRILVSPTVLELTGILRDADGNELETARVSFNSTTFSQVNIGSNGWVSANVDATGAYRALVVLKDGMVSGTVGYRALYLDGELTANRTFDVQPSAVTNVVQPFTFTERYLTFEGDFTNAHAEGAELYATRVTVSSPTHGTLCENGTPTAPANGGYLCRAAITTTEPFSWTYTVSGAWGTEVITGSVTSLPPVGRNQFVTRDLALHPTTLHLRGTVKQGTSPVNGASVQVSSDLLAPSRVAAGDTTRTDGVYDFYVVLKSDVTDGTLPFTVMSNTITQNVDVAFTATAGAQTLVERSFEFAARRVTFRGDVEHAAVAGPWVTAKQIAVSSPEVGPLCTWQRTVAERSYSCSVDMQRAEPFSVVYTVIGDWGTEVVTSTTLVTPPAVGATRTVDHMVKVSPAMLHLYGSVRDGSVANPDTAGMANVNYLALWQPVFGDAIRGPTQDGRERDVRVLCDGERGRGQRDASV